MKNIILGKTDISVPQIAIGRMRMNRLTVGEAEKYINTALENGANFFDHADIYGGGSL